MRARIVFSILAVFFLIACPELRAQSLLDLGIQAFNLEDYEQAASYLNEYIGDFPQSRQAHEYLINSYLAMKQYDRAIEYLENAIEIFPNNAQFLKLLGQLYAQKQDYLKSKSVFEKYLKLNPNDSETITAISLIYFNLGIASAKQKNKEQAISYFKKTIEYDSSYMEAYTNIAALMIEMKDYSKSRQHLEKSIERFPYNYTYRKALFDVLIKLEDLDTALPILEDIHSHEPDNIDIALQMAMLYRYQNKIDEAIALYDSLIKRFPRERKIYQAIIDYWRNFGRQEKIRETYELMTKAFPDDLSILKDIAITYERQEKWPEARAEYQNIITRDPASIETRIAIANAFRKEANDSSAIEVLREALSIEENNYDALKSLGIIYIDNSNYEAALDLYRTFYGFYNSNFYPAFRLGTTYLSIEQLDSAGVYLEIALTASSNEPLAWFKLAEIESLKGNKSDAIEIYKRALRFAIRRMETLQKEFQTEFGGSDGALQLDELGQYETLRDRMLDYQDIINLSLNYIKNNITRAQFGQLLDLYLEDYPNSTFLYLFKAAWLEQAEKDDEALALYKRVISLQPKSIQAHQGMATIYEKKNNYDEALLSYKRMLAADEENSIAYDGIIRLSHEAGKLDELCDEWLKLSRTQPLNKELEQRLIEILHKANRYNEARAIVESNIAEEGKK